MNMAEFCLDCWNELMGTDDPPEKYRISKELDFCEKCCQWKSVIITMRKRYIIKERFLEFLSDVRYYREEKGRP